MNSQRFHESFLKRDWFPEYDALPDGAMQHIVQRTLDLQQALASGTLRFHEVTMPVGFVESQPIPHSTADQLTHQYPATIRSICAYLSSVVMDFYDEPDHHRDLEAAVRLYAWGLFLVHLVHDSTITDTPQLADYAHYRLDELYGESLVHKHLEKIDEELGEARTGKTSKQEIRYLINAFVTVYRALLNELFLWRKLYPYRPIIAFPALSVEQFLEPDGHAPGWSASAEPERQATEISMPFYEWHLVTMLLAESCIHAASCQFPFVQRPVLPPAWLPRHQQHITPYTIVQSRATWKALVSLLDGLTRHFAVHYSSDVAFSSYIPEQALRTAIMHRLYTLAHTPEAFQDDQRRGRTYHSENLGRLSWYIARRIEEQL